MSKIKGLFDIENIENEEEESKETLPADIDPAGLAEMRIEEGEGTIEIAIDALKAQKLNAFVSNKLVKLYTMAESAAEQLVEDVIAGDTDARSIEGTARLIESGVKAITELNKYNMFLQQQIYDVRVREEVEKLHAQLKDQNIRSNRESILRVLKSGEEE